MLDIMRSVALLALLTGFIGTGSAKKCQNITIPVAISVRNAVFNVTAPRTKIDVTNFILNLAQQGHNYSQAILQGYATVNGTYELATTYCEPDSGAGNMVQLLTHGIGFDRSYWDLPFNNYNYSYVNKAVDEYKYSTLSWDRLGIAMSQHGEPVNEIQETLELAALYALTTLLRNQGIGSACTKFNKVVHVGHSFGSVLSYGIGVLHPESTDGLILTGVTHNNSFVPSFAYGGNFVPANTIPALAQYPPGYVAGGDSGAVHTNFFAPNSFDPAILCFAEANGQPATVGELLTIGGQLTSPNPITGPALVIVGGRDLPFCGGDCLATGRPDLPSILDASKPFFPNASVFESYVVSGTGHGLNLAYSHVETYTKILDFLRQNVK